MDSAKERYCRRDKRDEKIIQLNLGPFKRNDSDNRLRQTDFAERMNRYRETMTMREKEGYLLCKIRMSELRFILFLRG